MFHRCDGSHDSNQCLDNLNLYQDTCAKVAKYHSIGVNHWNDFEGILPEEVVILGVAQDFIDKASNDEGTACFTWVNSSS